MRIRETVILLCVLCCFAAVRGVAAPVVTVGPNVHVSTANPYRDHFEVEMAADPEDANNLIACSHIGGPGWIHTANYMSTDAGRSWHTGIIVGGKYDNSDDPACGFGLNHEAYALSLWRDGVAVMRSSNLGKTWTGPAMMSSIDREYFSIDRTGGKYRGRIYVNGTGFVTGYDAGAPDHSLATMFRSVDGGKVFSPAVNAISAKGHWILGMGNGVVLADGTFGFIFGEWETPDGGPKDSLAKNGWLKFITSTDGGRHFEQASIIAERRTCDKGPLWGGGLIPYIAVDQTKGPFHNRLYAVFDDRNSGRCVMRVSHSSDSGKSWSDPVTVDRNIETQTDPQGPESSIPAIAVNKNGVVGVTWYNRASDPANFRRKMRFVASVDGGESFTAPVAVSTVANAPSWHDTFIPPGGSASSSESGIQGSVSQYLADIDSGDTGGLAAGADGVFHALWSDDRTHVSQLWTSAISVSGRAYRNGDPSLDALTEVSKSIKMQLLNPHLNAAKQQLSLNIVLTNTGKKPLYGPFKVRLYNLGSQWSNHVTAQTTDNGNHEDDVIWTFVPSGGGSVLAPKAKSAVRSVVFVLHGLKPIGLRALEDPLAESGLLTFSGHVLAKEKR